MALATVIAPAVRRSRSSASRRGMHGPRHSPALPEIPGRGQDFLFLELQIHDSDQATCCLPQQSHGDISGKKSRARRQPGSLSGKESLLKKETADLWYRERSADIYGSLVSCHGHMRTQRLERERARKHNRALSRGGVCKVRKHIIERYLAVPVRCEHGKYVILR